MPKAEFFALFGLLPVRNFLEPALCVDLQSQMRAGGRKAASVFTDNRIYEIDSSYRSAHWVQVSPDTVSLTELRLQALQPKLESHFQVALQGCQPPQFLAYDPGDFYKPHRDSSDAADASQTAKKRLISVVVFVNGESPEPAENSYGGGSLTFHGLMDKPKGNSLGFRLVGEAGLLIAFRSGLLHEVTPVTHGQRYTIASWYV